MRPRFSLFQSHLDFAHKAWSELLQPTDNVIDATCGNGHDALILATLSPMGKLYLIDIQKQALEETYNKLPKTISSHLSFHNICHSKIDELAPPSSIKLIVYNLGYLPRADKSLTTQTETTLQSIEKSVLLICPGGMISITCYPGHAEGECERAAIIERTQALCPKEWSVSVHSWNNRNKHPCLILIQRRIE